MVFKHTLPSGTVMTAMIPPPDEPPLLMLEGEPGHGEQAEVSLWLDTVVMPAFAQQTLDFLTGNIDP